MMRETTLELGPDAAGIAGYVQDAVARIFDDKEAAVGSDTMRMLEKHIMLTVLDQSWKEHLGRMDYLRQGIHLRGYAQKQPKQEYKKEAFELFGEEHTPGTLPAPDEEPR